MVVTISMTFLMGIIVHVLMILLMFVLPDGKGISTIMLIGLPVLITYPMYEFYNKVLILVLNYYNIGTIQFLEFRKTSSRAGSI